MNTATDLRIPAVPYLWIRPRYVLLLLLLLLGGGVLAVVPVGRLLGL
jgi:hypothetical protein